MRLLFSFSFPSFPSPSSSVSSSRSSAASDENSSTILLAPSYIICSICHRALFTSISHPPRKSQIPLGELPLLDLPYPGTSPRFLAIGLVESHSNHDEDCPLYCFPPTSSIAAHYLLPALEVKVEECTGCDTVVYPGGFCHESTCPFDRVKVQRGWWKKGMGMLRGKWLICKEMRRPGLRYGIDWSAIEGENPGGVELKEGNKTNAEEEEEEDKKKDNKRKRVEEKERKGGKRKKGKNEKDEKKKTDDEGDEEQGYKLL